VTLIFTATSTVAHQRLWLLLERPHLNIWVDIWPMFLGNALGPPMVLYGFKFALDRWGRRMSQQLH
jgi:hypothetical protein